MRKYLLLLALVCGTSCFAQQLSNGYVQLENAFLRPSAEARPWVFWYWMKGAYSEEGITADLEAMKRAGIGGAYLMPIQSAPHPLYKGEPVLQLSPRWWSLVHFAMKEAKRLNLQLGMHVCDGFALAGGPWITPELSMQKLVWSSSIVSGGTTVETKLPQPSFKEHYYRDIAVYAFREKTPEKWSFNEAPKVTTSNNARAAFLNDPGNKEGFRSEDSCWIQYEFKTPFTCRSIRISTGGNNFQANRLWIQVSNDGVHFTNHTRLEPPRHGWQNTDEEVTHSVPEVTAKYFRFAFSKDGTEPGAEDIDAAKWKPTLKLTGILLSSSPVIHQFEGKNASVWRVSTTANEKLLPKEICVDTASLRDISAYMDANGKLTWSAPEGKWTILRMGHTSTGHTNYTGGAALGLECDKFNPQAVALQFNQWFAKAFSETDSLLAREVLKIFHVDSWECGSQNWSPVFAEVFKKKRGYDLLRFLPVMAGVPLENAAFSEKVLLDVRNTITELVQENFYTILAEKAHAYGTRFSAESMAPTMAGDGMLHYGKVDLPMGEFWYKSPTHDKPNDMLDAISGAHIYGKKIVQAESFTTVRMDWSEHPGQLKTTGDRNLALGVNKLVFHVFTHNPDTSMKPGITLDGVGLFFQKNQTWWEQGRAWMDYLTRSQSVLQQGIPVTDLAVFTGEDIPRRSVLPDRLVPLLPGIFGKERVDAEAERLRNKGVPMAEMPAGVSHVKNMTKAEDWVDALNGYQYDSFNKDALLNLAKVKDGKIVLPGGAAYAALVLPGTMKLMPNGTFLSAETVDKVLQLVREGAMVMLNNEPALLAHFQKILPGANTWEKELRYGKGKFVRLPWEENTFNAMGITPDIRFFNQEGMREKNIAWTHRSVGNTDVYFLSNQDSVAKQINVRTRAQHPVWEQWDPLSGAQFRCNENGRINITLEPNGTCFLIGVETGNAKFHKPVTSTGTEHAFRNWKLFFDTAYGGPVHPIEVNNPFDWRSSANDSIRYYSGTVVYEASFHFRGKNKKRQYFIETGLVNNIASVTLNGKDCGVVWTAPFRLNVTGALKKGKNTLRISVSNTWANRLIGDQQVPETQRITRTSAPFRLNKSPLLPAGLTQDVFLRWERSN